MRVIPDFQHSGFLSSKRVTLGIDGASDLEKVIRFRPGAWSVLLIRNNLYGSGLFRMRKQRGGFPFEITGKYR